MDRPELLAELNNKINDILDYGNSYEKSLFPKLIRIFHQQIMKGDHLREPHNLKLLCQKNTTFML